MVFLPHFHYKKSNHDAVLCQLHLITVLLLLLVFVVLFVLENTDNPVANFIMK